MKTFAHHHLHRATVHLDAAKQRVRIEVTTDTERIVLEVDRATLTVNGGDTPGQAHSPDWVAGVRWAAAEADAQASGREPVYILDVTDHLRLCATDPGRGSAVARSEAPEHAAANETGEPR